MTGSWKKIIVAVTILLMAGGSGWLVAGYYLEGGDMLARIPFLGQKRDVQRGAKEETSDKASPELTVRFYLPDGAGLKVEERRAPGEMLSVRLAEYLVGEYLKSLPGSLSETRVLGVYKDREGILYLDLSDDLRRNFAGDARQEYYLIKALYETVSRNSPAVRDVKILFEGREAETIGGHFSLLRPLKTTFGDQGLQ